MKSVFDEVRGLQMEKFISLFMGDTNPRRSGQWARHCACPACGESPRDSIKLATKDDFWTCHACGESGDAIKAGQAMWGCSPLEAAQRIAKAAGTGHVDDDWKQKQAEKRQAEVSQDAAKGEACQMVYDKLIAAFGGVPREGVMDYLVKQRLLDRYIVEKAMQRGALVMLPENPHELKRRLGQMVSRDVLNTSGIWLAEKEWPRICAKPLMFPLNDLKGAEFRMIKQPGEGELKAMTIGQKNQPWKWVGKGNKVIVVEGMIETLSAASMGFEGHVMGLPGVSSWVNHHEWFAKLKGKDVQIILNNDLRADGKNPGQVAAKKLLPVIKLVEPSSLINKVGRPGVDLNDLLKEKALKQIDNTRPLRSA